MRRFVWTSLFYMAMAATAWAGDPYCTDHYGQPVVWVEQQDQSKLANALYQFNGQPVIVTNADAAKKSGLSEDSIQFLKLHECGHLVLGHKVRPGTTVQAFRDIVDQADCWAANKFFYAGEEEKLKAIESEINEMDQGNWVNIAGPVRKLDLENTCRFKTPVWSK